MKYYIITRSVWSGPYDTLKDALYFKDHCLDEVPNKYVIVKRKESEESWVKKSRYRDMKANS